MTRSSRYDVIVVGAGHNGLVAATLLARAGRRVLLLEQADHPGGAAVSARVFDGLDARLSRYAYLVSLFPRQLLSGLAPEVRLRRREVSSYTPVGDGGVLVDGAHSPPGFDAFYERIGGLARATFPTLTEPLRAAAELRDRAQDPELWTALFERPLAELLETAFPDDVLRGIVATDGLIGTFAALDDPSLLQNRCFLYHVIGNGTGHWDVPVGGMGAVTDALTAAARSAGVELCLGAEVTQLDADLPGSAAVRWRGREASGDAVIAACAPATLATLLGDPAPGPAPEGSQLKLNLLLSRLPRLRDPQVTPEQAFAGTLHVNESATQIESAYAQAASGRLPDLVPCEAYCHSLSDPTILGPELRAAGAQTLTVFALHMPARLFAADHDTVKRDAVTRTLASLNAVLAEPIEDCLMTTPSGEPCLEARTPQELERELGLPGGHIFHRDLSWPFAEAPEEIGTWGTETPRPQVMLGGAGARRGGGVSGIPGHNAARALLARGWPLQTCG